MPAATGTASSGAARRALGLALALALAASGASSACDARGGRTDATAASDAGAATDGGGAGGDAGTGGDLAVLAAMRAGTLPVQEGLLQVAWSNGWPIDGGDGRYWFAHADDGAGPWALAGDHSAWSAEPMALEGGVWWIAVTVAAPDGAGYKLVDGGGTFVADPWARRYDYDAFGELSLVAASGERFERWPGAAAGTLAPRTVRLRVPAVAPTHVLYVHDGQNVFDPGAPWGGWNLQGALAASTLVVAIDNTADRMDEYTHVADYLSGAWIGGAGDAYVDWLVDEVVPLFEAEYGAAGAARGVLGSSLGGLVSFHAALRRSGTFDFVGSLSGTFGWGSIGAMNETMIERWSGVGPTGAVLYLDSGGGPGAGGVCLDADGDGVDDDTPDADDNYCETRQLADTLAAAGWTWDADLVHWWEPGATHDEGGWAARVWRPVGIFEGL